jgi:hypothetical protein
MAGFTVSIEAKERECTKAACCGLTFYTYPIKLLHVNILI